MPQLEDLSIEELSQELVRRKAARVVELRGKEKLAREALAEIEKEIRALHAEGIPTTARKASPAKRGVLQAGCLTNKAKVLEALAAGPKQRGELLAATGFGMYTLRHSVREMLKAGDIVREGTKSKAVYFVNDSK